MKRNPAEYRIRERMAPGVLSQDGFLGDDDRNLDDVVEEDLAELDAAGLTREQIADLLQEIHDATDAALESTVSLCNGAITAQMTEGMGRIPCPFACGKRSHKGVITIQSPDKVLRITPLHIHLIRAHGFFQGRGSTFRLEPADAIALYRLCRPDA